jgi:WD40 repeat protein
MNRVLTASEDMTIRQWVNNNEKTVPNSEMHILAGHKDKVTCLGTYHNFLISGSKDNSIIFWHKDKIWTKKAFNSSIVSI